MTEKQLVSKNNLNLAFFSIRFFTIYTMHRSAQKFRFCFKNSDVWWAV